MAKSEGNVVTISELLKDWPGEAVRFAMLQAHYRQPFNWTEAAVREAKRTLDHWYALTADVAPGMLCADALAALADDLNTPQAFAAMQELRSEAAKRGGGAAASLKATGQLMGLLQQSARQWVAWRPASIEIDEGRVEASIAARNAARKARNFKEADRIRDELAKMGVVLHDSKDGTTWEVAR
jgi:cysteinyl-tRNA synthetase